MVHDTSPDFDLDDQNGNNSPNHHDSHNPHPHISGTMPMCINCSSWDGEDSINLKTCEKCLMDLRFDVDVQDEGWVLDEIKNLLENFGTDVTSAFKNDPAAKSIVEVLSSYPGIQAVLIYRIAHLFWKLKVPFLPRYLSSIARQITGIDIHPGAVIGKNFFIDHGQGVVIGETAEIGDNVTIYQGVTLGGVSLENKKRHPTLKDDIVVGAGAKILGPIIIGEHTKIGANSVVIHDVPPNSVVVGIPGRIVNRTKNRKEQGLQLGSDNEILTEKEEDSIRLKHNDLPDPILRYIQNLEERLVKLEQEKLKKIE